MFVRSQGVPKLRGIASGQSSERRGDQLREERPGPSSIGGGEGRGGGGGGAALAQPAVGTGIFFMLS